MTRSDRDPQDFPDELRIGDLPPIPIFEDDDFRFLESRERAHRANVVAQGLHSADELLGGLTDSDPDIRVRVIPRLVARWASDARVMPALLVLLVNDPDPSVRDGAAMNLLDFLAAPEIVPALRIALSDVDEDVRWSARYVLSQLEAGAT